MRASEQAGAPLGQAEAGEGGTRQPRYEKTPPESPFPSPFPSPFESPFPSPSQFLSQLPLQAPCPSPSPSHTTPTPASDAVVVDPCSVAGAAPVEPSRLETSGSSSTRVSREVEPPPVAHRGVLDVVLPMRPELDLGEDSERTEQFVFPALWRTVAVVWWAVASVAAVVLVATVHTGLPFMVDVVLSAGLFTIPGLGISRLLVRRSHPGQREMWWLFLYGLRCFFVYGYMAAAILIARWLADQPVGSVSWNTARAVAVGFGAVAIVAWGLVVQDTVRHGVGGRDRSELAVDLAMAAVVVSGPALVFGSTLVPGKIHAVASALGALQPVDAAFGIAAAAFWCAVAVKLLSDTTGLRAMSVDALDLVALVVVLASPPMVALAPVLGDHMAVLWLTLPLVFLAVVLPGQICAAIMLMVRVAQANRRIVWWLVTLLVVSTADAWAQLAMALSGYRLPAPPFIAAASINFGFFLLLPLVERRRLIVGFGRLGPGEQLRRWDVVPAVVALGALALVVQFLVSDPAGVVRIAMLAVLGLMVLFGSSRHYAGVRETRKLHHKVEEMTDELYSQSRVDPLTGLCNRRALYERFPQIAASCARSKRPLSVVMIDLDNFKRFNDMHGHLAGDGVLREVATLVRSVLRGEDLAARFGGEELCLLLPGADPAQGAMLLEHLRRDRSAVGPVPAFGLFKPAGPAFGGQAHDPAFDLASPAASGAANGATHGPDRVVVTFSAGVAQWRPGDRLEDVLRRADAACYTAKALGRDRVVVDGSGDPTDPVAVPPIQER